LEAASIVTAGSFNDRLRKIRSRSLSMRAVQQASRNDCNGQKPRATNAS